VFTTYDVASIDFGDFTHSRSSDASQLKCSAYGPIASVEVIDLDCIRGIGFKASERLNDSDCIAPWMLSNRSIVLITSNKEFTGGGQYWSQNDPAIAGIPVLLTDDYGNSRALVSISQPLMPGNNCNFFRNGALSTFTNIEAATTAAALSDSLRIDSLTKSNN
jgi:hypothetical protein